MATKPYPDTQYNDNWLAEHNRKVKGQGDVLPPSAPSYTGIQESNVGPNYTPASNTPTQGNNNMDPDNDLYSMPKNNFGQGLDKYGGLQLGSNLGEYVSADSGKSIMDYFNQNQLDPFQNFQFGMNMPTFGLAKGVVDTGANIMGLWNNIENLDLKKDQFDFTKEMGNKQFGFQKDLANNQLANANFSIDERNAFKKAYGGPDGNYLQQDRLNPIG